MLGYVSFAVLLVFLIVKRSEILAIVARWKFQKGETESSLKLFGIANRIGKLKPASLFYYGYILLRTGDIDAAEQVLTRGSLDAKKTNIQKRIKAMLSLVVWKKGDLDTAIEMMEEAMQNFKLTSFYQNLGLMYVIKGDRKKALEFNLEAYDYNSDDLVIMDNLAESYALCGETQKAKTMYEALLKKEPHFPEPYYGYGLLLIDSGKKEEGLDYIRQSLDKRFSFLSIMQKEEVEALLTEKSTQ